LLEEFSQTAEEETEIELKILFVHQKMYGSSGGSSGRIDFQKLIVSILMEHIIIPLQEKLGELLESDSPADVLRADSRLILKEDNETAKERAILLPKAEKLTNARRVIQQFTSEWRNGS